MPSIPDSVLLKAKAATVPIDADVFLYNGSIEGKLDLPFIQAIDEAKSRPAALLLLATNGGSPDAAYKITRYFQDRYDSFTVLIAGRCKSAGTLIAVGASELAFMPYGELGPLDIQLTKVDRLGQAQSGLNIQEALDLLEGRATSSFHQVASSYIQASQGVLSFPVVSKAAADFVTQLYAPMLSRIDPEEVGARTRSMQIAIEYGRRLAAKWGNVKPDALQRLAETYPSHSFVIDMQEAASLFNEVRIASDLERALVEALGDYARFQMTGPGCTMHVLSEPAEEKDEDDATEPEGRGEPPDSGNPAGTGRTSDLPPDAAAAAGQMAAE